MLETSINGARGVLINITASPDVGLDEVDEASTMISKSAHPDCNVIWGAAFNDSFEDEIQITVIATGFDSIGEGNKAAEPAAKAAPRAESPVKAEPETRAQEESDDYFDLLKIFNKRSSD